ncbi:hypothetical protein Hdeb2414_s0016g00490411 [Helianthus debilis subsp. tardiflorus]
MSFLWGSGRTRMLPRSTAFLDGCIWCRVSKLITIRVNCLASVLTKMKLRLVSSLNYEVGSLPFTYLGIPIGVNMKRAKFWSPVVEKFKSKLSKWKERYLSFSGRVTMAKSVLGSLPSYYLSLSVAPKCILNKLESIRRDFVWGFFETNKKLRWVKWEGLLKSKNRGGLGIGNLTDFNNAMLSKWWWRFKSDPNQFWARVILSIQESYCLFIVTTRITC